MNGVNVTAIAEFIDSYNERVGLQKEMHNMQRIWFIISSIGHKSSMKYEDNHITIQ